MIAMTLTLVAVYAPMAFATGRTGKLFIEFALTLAGAVLVSGFVALTLTPMMCALLRYQESHGRIYQLAGALFRNDEERLSARSAAALGMRFVVVALALAVPVPSYFFFTHLRSELAPIVDRGTVTAIGVAPEGATLAFTAEHARRVSKRRRRWTPISLSSAFPT